MSVKETNSSKSQKRDLFNDVESDYTDEKQKEIKSIIKDSFDQSEDKSVFVNEQLKKNIRKKNGALYIFIKKNIKDIHTD